MRSSPARFLFPTALLFLLVGLVLLRPREWRGWTNPASCVELLIGASSTTSHDWTLVGRGGEIFTIGPTGSCTQVAALPAGGDYYRTTDLGAGQLGVFRDDGSMFVVSPSEGNAAGSLVPPCARDDVYYGDLLRSPSGGLYSIRSVLTDSDPPVRRSTLVRHEDCATLRLEGSVGESAVGNDRLYFAELADGSGELASINLHFEETSLVPSERVARPPEAHGSSMVSQILETSGGGMLYQDASGNLLVLVGSESEWVEQSRPDVQVVSSASAARVLIGWSSDTLWFGQLDDSRLTWTDLGPMPLGFTRPRGVSVSADGTGVLAFERNRFVLGRLPE